MWRILALLVLFAATQSAVAWPFHGDGSGTVQLANVTNTFGNKTLAGYGEERLSRTNQNYGAKYSPYGTGVLVSGSCAKWSTSVTFGNASYWNLLSHVAEGASAVTPNLTATGVTNLAGGAGSHTDFLVSCEDASNNVLATATLTYLINDGLNNCGAINIGSTDNTGVTYWPSGFGASIDGCYVQMSTGFVKTGRFGIGMPFAHRVYLTMADPARPGELQNIETNSNSTNITMKDIMVLGNISGGLGMAAAFVLGGTDISGDNLHRYSTLAQRTAASYSCINTSTGNTVTTPQSVTHFGCEWVAGNFVPSSNYTYQYFWSRFAQSDSIITTGYTHDFKVLDGIIFSMKTPGANHPDCFQIGDGATLWNFEAKRLMCYAAGGDIGTQGIFFGGGPSGVFGTWTGYVSDSSCSGAAGQTLCVTNLGAQSNANGSKIFASSGSPMAVSDGVTVNCGATPCPLGAGVKYTLTGLPGNVNIGSAASPVEFHGSYNVGAVWDMIWNAGFVPQGVFPAANSGTSSISHFTDNYETVPGVSPTPLPHLLYQNCTSNPYAWIGNLTVSNGAEFNTYVSGCAGGVLPNGVTQTNVLNALQNVTTLGTWYVNGDPQACLEAKSPAQYDAMTVQQVMVYGASCTLPKVSGPLDLGGGDVAGAISTAATPTWQDGTVVGTGFTGQ